MIKMEKNVYLYQQGMNYGWMNLIRIENSDVFNLDNSYYDLNFIQSLLNKFEIVEVDNHAALFKKLVMGDKGDNVPCPYKTLTSRLEKNVVLVKPVQKKYGIILMKITMLILIQIIMNLLKQLWKVLQQLIKLNYLKIDLIKLKQILNQILN
jgi:hypothetical protein